MIIKGIKKINTLNGEIEQEVDMTAIPEQMRVYFKNPITYSGILRWLECGVTAQGEVLPSVNNGFELPLDEIKEIIFSDVDDPEFNEIKTKQIQNMIGLDLLKIMRVLFIKNITKAYEPVIEPPTE